MNDVRLRRLARADDATVRAVHRVVAAVVERGGAVGWWAPPTHAEIAAWLTDWVERQDSGRAAFHLADLDGRTEAIGGWQAGPPGPVGHVVELTKVMTHPDARGRGLGRLVTERVVEDAEASGAELLVLGVRGNNHAARDLYASLGFTVWGVLPDGVAVDEHRFDDVRMYRALPTPPGVVRHGTEAGGPGGS